jgi:hypothetical protein
MNEFLRIRALEYMGKLVNPGANHLGGLVLLVGPGIHRSGLPAIKSLEK